jgi:hypothetical protein
MSGRRPQGSPSSFTVGQPVRYRPGYGTYGYEQVIEADGRIPAKVIGLTPSRVRIQFKLTEFGSVKRAVDAASLVAM